MALALPKFTRLRRRRNRGLAPELQELDPQPGDTYELPVCFTTDPLIGPAGFYATDPVSNQPIPHLRLTVVPNPPGSADPDGHTFVVADPKAPYYATTPAGSPVTLQVNASGKGSVSA